MIWWLVASTLALAAGCAVIAANFHIARQALDGDQAEAPEPHSGQLTRRVLMYFSRAGITLAPERTPWLLVGLALLCTLTLAALPSRFGALGIASSLLLIHLFLRGRGARQRRRTVEQLPSFLNQVIRRIAAAAPVELAIHDSLESVDQPLRGILERAERRVRLGHELHASMEREAVITGLNEFKILATALRLNQQYGGSIRGLLENIVAMLLAQQEAQRELKALTGETRITAAVLAALPLAAAAYMLAINPSFFLKMWQDPFGHQLLVTAVAMETLGIAVLWRMVKSV